MFGEWKVKIIDSGYKEEKDVFIFRRLGEGKMEVLGNERIEDYGAIKKPTLQLNSEQLQKFAEALNEIGVKPQDGFLEGKLEATEKHLEDMRKLVFEK